MKAKLLALALFFVLMAGCTLKTPGPPTATTDCPQGTGWNGVCCTSAGTCMEKSTAMARMLWDNWQSVGALVILMGFLLMGLLFMAARAFGYKQLEIFVKNEMVQLAASAFLFGSVIFLMSLMETYSQDFAGQILAIQGGAGSVTHIGDEWVVGAFSKPVNVSREIVDGTGAWTGRWRLQEIAAGGTFNCPSPCHFYLARSYLGMNYERIAGEQGANGVKGVARDIVKMYASLSWIDYTRVGGWVNILGIAFGISFTMMPFTGLSIIYHSLGTCFDFMVKAMISLKFQEMVLLYLQNGVFPIFLVGGLVVRSVWFLRKLGGLMIAIAIGVYTVFPLLYVLCWYTVDSSTMTMQIDASMVPSGNIRTSILPWEAINLGMNDDDLERLLFTQYETTASCSNPPCTGLLEITSGLLIPALAVPLLNMFITIAFIKTLSSSIGGDMEIAGLTRIL